MHKFLFRMLQALLGQLFIVSNSEMQLLNFVLFVCICSSLDCKGQERLKKDFLELKRTKNIMTLALGDIVGD